MLEILKFIFSSFWIWLGTLLLLDTVFGRFGVTINNIISKAKTGSKNGKEELHVET